MEKNLITIGKDEIEDIIEKSYQFILKKDGNIYYQENKDDLKEKVINLASQKAEKLRDKEQERNIEFKKGLPLLITVIIFCVVGSIAGYFITRTNDGNTSLGYWTILASTSIGVQFIVNPSGNKSRQSKRKTHPLVLTILFGMFIGFICGFQGTGGGMWMLFALSIVLAFFIFSLRCSEMLERSISLDLDIP